MEKDSRKGEAGGRSPIEEEFGAFMEKMGPEELDQLGGIMEGMLKRQKASEAEKYKSLLTPPSEAMEIIHKAGGSTLLMVDYGQDLLRYLRAEYQQFGERALELWSLGYLLEAGRIIGMRQERARRRRSKPRKA